MSTDRWNAFHWRVAAGALLVVCSACQKPDLRILDVQAQYNASGDRFDVECEVENRSYSGNLFVRPGPARGPCSVHAWLSGDGESLDKPVSIHFRFLLPDQAMQPGETKSVTCRTTASFTPLFAQYAYLVLLVDSLDQENEWSESNNTFAIPTPVPGT